MWNNYNEFLSVGSDPSVTYYSLGLLPLLKNVMYKKSSPLSDEKDVCLYEMMERGYIDVKTGLDPFINKIKELGGNLFYKKDSIHQFFMLKNGIIELEFNNNYVTVCGLSQNNELITELKKFVISKLITPTKQGHIFAITKTSGRLSLSSLGNAGINLNKYNYNSSVISDYNYIVEDLKSNSPSGRIAILEGAPGTGKTHIIRALLNDVSDAMFVLVSPDMLTSLAGPELLPLLLTQKQSYATKGPIILVLEDADKCLVARDSDNINSIQALLNLGDGILGSMLDLRIIATTNAKKMEMEAAILRPGRLSKRVEVGHLNQDVSLNLFKHLLPEQKIPEQLLTDSRFTLAEVYSMARNHGWKAVERVVKVPVYDEYGDEIE